MKMIGDDLTGSKKMEYSQWIANKNYADTLINKVGIALGENKDWLKAYRQDVLAVNANTLDILLKCFQSIEKQLTKDCQIAQESKIGVNVMSYCPKCHYNRPFCLFKIFDKCTN